VIIDKLVGRNVGGNEPGLTWDTITTLGGITDENHEEFQYGYLVFRF
jgi:hypothetical protein